MVECQVNRCRASFTCYSRLLRCCIDKVCFASTIIKCKRTPSVDCCRSGECIDIIRSECYEAISITLLPINRRSIRPCAICHCHFLSNERCTSLITLVHQTPYLECIEVVGSCVISGTCRVVNECLETDGIALSHFYCLVTVASCEREAHCCQTHNK